MSEYLALTGNCWAKNRPSLRAAVHLTYPDAERTLCGVLRGDPSGDTAVTCYTCRQALRDVLKAEHEANKDSTRELTPEDQATLAAAENEMAELWAQIDIGPAAASVYCTYNELLIAMIRRVPAAKWNKPDRCWIIPSGQAPKLAGKFRDAGVDVTIHELTPVSWATLLLRAATEKYARRVYDALADVFTPGTPQRAELEAAAADWLAEKPGRWSDRDEWWQK